MPRSQVFLDLYIEEYLKNNPSENKTVLQKRLNDVFGDTNKESQFALTEQVSAESDQAPKEKSYTLKEIRLKYERAYMPWTDELDLELTVMYNEGTTLRKMAEHFGRTRGSINSRLKKLDLNG